MDESLLPDILDQVGRQPREFGALQLHVDPVVRAAESTRATASIWLQGAFTPMAPNASLRVLDAATRRELLCAALPSLERGQVLRWTLPLSLDSEVRELLFQPVAPVPDGAVRVRPPWRLFDTLELVKETHVAAKTDFITGAAVRLALGRLPAAALLGAASSPVQEQLRTKQHAARAMPDGFVAEITSGSQVAGATEAPEAVTVWEPGQSFDAAPWRESPSALHEGDARRVRCACGMVASRDAEFCPSCLASLAGASVSVESAAPLLSDLAQGGLLGALRADAAPAVDTGPRCPRHAQVEETRTCPRCGGFYCDACLPDALEAERTHCPACLAREQDVDPVRLRRTLVRDMAWVHGAVAGVLVVTGLLGSVSASSGSQLNALVGGACFAAIYLGLAGLLALTRNTVVAWGVFAFDVLVGCAAFFLGGYLDGGAILVAAAISCMQLIKANGLPRAAEPA
ncbi:hypothetical protein ACLESD_04885 [Pyxidicoccus sp. 3LFB2]